MPKIFSASDMKAIHLQVMLSQLVPNTSDYLSFSLYVHAISLNRDAILLKSSHRCLWIQQQTQ